MLKKSKSLDVESAPADFPPTKEALEAVKGYTRLA